MSMSMKMLAGAAGLAAFAAAAPAAAQYYPYPQPQPRAYGYGYTQPQPRAYGYGYAQPYGYGSPYGYNPAQAATQMATQRCMAAVQQRLHQPRTMSGILGAMLGARASAGRVLGITQVSPSRSRVRVRGVATSGANYGYGPYGVGAYGAYGYAHQPDLSFRCDVDYQGRIRDVDINRRR